MNDNLFAFKITKYGNSASNDTCMLYRPCSITTEKKENKEINHITELTMVGLFLIGMAVALTNGINMPFEPENQITEVTQEQDLLLEPTG